MEQHAKKINIVKDGLKYVTVVSFGDVKLTYEEDGSPFITYHDKKWDFLTEVDDMDVIREFYGRKYISRWLDTELVDHPQISSFINEAMTYGSESLRMKLLLSHVSQISTDVLLDTLPDIHDQLAAGNALNELVKRGQNATNVILFMSEEIGRYFADKYKEGLFQGAK